LKGTPLPYHSRLIAEGKIAFVYERIDDDMLFYERIDDD